MVGNKCHISEASWILMLMLLSDMFIFLLFIFCGYFFVVYFLFWEREIEIQRERACMKEGQIEGGTERIPSRLCTVSTEPIVGLHPTNLWDHDLSQNQESAAVLSELPTCPSVISLVVSAMGMEDTASCQTNIHSSFCLKNIALIYKTMICCLTANWDNQLDISGY